MKHSSFLSIRRLVVTLIVLQFSFLLLIGKLFTIQVPEEDSSLIAPKDWRSNGKSDVKRGKILDRHGYVLSISQDTIAVCADPKTLNRKSNAHSVATELAPLLDASTSELLKQLKRKRSGEYVEFVWLKKGIEYEKLDPIRDIVKKHRGLKVEVEPKRVYPNKTLASQVIGYLNDLNEGEGIEYQYNNYLQRVHTPIPEKNQKLTSGSLTSGLSTHKLGNNGCNVILTLDQVIQDIAEKAIVKACKDWKAPKGTAIVLAVDTSEILAMASYPTYNINDQSNANEVAKRNLGIWYLFEPGSIFKVVASSAVLNERIMTPECKVFCENGRYRLRNRRVIKDVSAKGWLTLTEVIHKSSNIGMIKIVQRLGPDFFQNYVDSFGFGERTGVDLPYEQSGSLYALRRWDTNSLGSVPFGQGISVTPLQMVNALAAIANGGILHQPYITKEVRDSQGNLIKKNSPVEVRRVLQPATAQQMIDILVGVVEKGSGARAKIEGISVAGKTGTAQKAEKGKGYAAGKEVMSFMGFLPADDPKIAIIVTLDEPKGARFSGQIAGPVFKRIAEQTLRYTQQTGFFDNSPNHRRKSQENLVKNRNVEQRTNSSNDTKQRTIKATPTSKSSFKNKPKATSDNQVSSLLKQKRSIPEEALVKTGDGL